MVFIIKLIDKHLGGMICNFLGLFSKKNKDRLNHADFRRILIVQLWGIGETILTLPSIDAIKKKFPEAEIDVLATSRNRDVFFNNKRISRVISLKLNPFSILKFLIKNFRSYDLAVDMEEYLNISAIITFFAGIRSVGYSHGSRAKVYTEKVKYNDKQHAVQTFLDLARKLNADYNTDRLPKLEFSKRDSNIVDKFLEKSGIKKGDFFACVAPGVAESAKSRMWPYDRYGELCDEIIIRHKARIVFIGSAGESELIDSIRRIMEKKDNTINSAGKITLNQLFCLIRKCSLFIGNDAGAMHVAAAQGVKTIGLFGPNLPVRFGPYGKDNIGIYKGYNCEFSPCINVHKGEVPNCLYPKDSNNYQKCMKNISVDDVLKEVGKTV